MTIGHYIYIISVSEYYYKSDWQNWADNQILKNTTVDDWIYKVSLAKNIEELTNVLNDKIIEECYFEEHNSSPSDAIVGYYYMKYLEKKINLYHLVSKLSDEDDISVSSSVHQKMNFYNIFKKLDSAPNIATDEMFLKHIDEILTPFILIAEKQKKLLELY